MIWWPLLFVRLLMADELSVEKYCFNSFAQIERAYSEFKLISVRVDRVEKDGLCMVISTPLHRRELIQKYLYAAHPDMTISFSNAENRTDLCNLKVEKIDVKQSQNFNARLDNSGPIEARDQQSESTETTHITTVKDFEISMDQDKILGECRYITPERYEITLTIKKDARLLLPPVPIGTGTGVTTPPPNQETAILKTQLQLQRGNRIEIGNIMLDLENKSHEASAEPQLEMKNVVRKKKVKTYLSIY